MKRRAAGGRPGFGPPSHIRERLAKMPPEARQKAIEALKKRAKERAEKEGSKADAKKKPAPEKKPAPKKKPEKKEKSDKDD